jgi:hypothetical protein
MPVARPVLEGTVAAVEELAGRGLTSSEWIHIVMIALAVVMVRRAKPQ